VTKPITARILESIEYQDGRTFTVATMGHRLGMTSHQIKSSIVYLCDKGLLVPTVKGNVTHYHKPSKHWINTIPLANSGKRCLAERVWL
jgi:predicted transcriptional regulator